MTDILNSNNLDNEQNQETMFTNQSTNTIQPDPNFRVELKNKIMNELNSQPVPNKVPSLRINFAFAGFAVLVLAVVSLVGQDLIFNRNNSTGLTAAEKQNILSKIASNNPLGLLQRNNNTFAMNANTEAQLTTGTGDAMAPSVSKDLAYYSVPPDMYNQDVYSYSRQEYTFGPKINTCPQYNYVPGVGDTITESYSYSTAWKENETPTYYSKYISKTKDGQIFDYSLSNDNVSYVYQGGSYAVKQIYPRFEPQNLLMVPSTSEELKLSEPGYPSDMITISEIPSPEPSPTMMPVDEQIAAMFGNPESIVVEKISENGKTYYVVTYNDPYTCWTSGDVYSNYRSSASGAMQPIQSNVKVITKAYVSTDNFSIEKQASYIDLIAPENLIMQTTYTNNTQSIPFDKVSSIFNFDLNVPVREITIPQTPMYGTDEYNTQMDAYIVTNPVVILTPQSNQVGASWVNVLFETDSAYLAYSSYFQDRNFYAPGAYGDALYDRYMQSQTTAPYIAPIYSVSYNAYSTEKYLKNLETYQTPIQDITWSLDIYPQGKTVTEIKSSVWGEEVDNYLQFEKKMNLFITGQTIEASVYDIPATSKIGGSEPVAIEGGASVSSDGTKMTIPDQYITPIPATNKVIMFVQNGHVYTITIYAQPVIDYQTLLSFNEIDLATANGRQALTNLMNSIQERNTPVVTELTPIEGPTTEILPR